MLYRLSLPGAEGGAVSRHQIFKGLLVILMFNTKQDSNYRRNLLFPIRVSLKTKNHKLEETDIN